MNVAPHNLIDWHAAVYVDDQIKGQANPEIRLPAFAPRNRYVVSLGDDYAGRCGTTDSARAANQVADEPFDRDGLAALQRRTKHMCRLGIGCSGMNADGSSAPKSP